MLRSQEAQLVKLIESQGMNRSDFEVSVPDAAVGKIQIKYRPANYWFMFEATRSHFGPVQWSPGDRQVIDSHGQNRLAWQKVIDLIKSWTSFLKRELQAEAYLTEAFQLNQGGIQNALIIPRVSDGGFSAEEQLRVEAGVQTVHAWLLEQGVANDAPAGRLSDVDLIRDILTEQSKTSSKQSWIMTLLSVMLGQFAGLLLQPEQLGEMMTVLSRVFGWIAAPPLLP